MRLYWRTHQRLAEDVRSFVHLDAPGTRETWVNVTKDLAGEIPSSRWPLDFYVVDDFRLAIPGDVPPVRAELTVGLLDRAGQRLALAGGGDTVSLGQVSLLNAPQLSNPAQLFARLPGGDKPYRLGDSISLAGYSAQLLPNPTGGADEVKLVLHWRTRNPLDVDYTVFAQLATQGQGVVGAGDGQPCAGACPTTAWTPGGTIEDMRIITVPPGVSKDGLEVLVGLYDLQSGQRLPIRDRQGARVPDDAIRLPVAAAATR